MSSTGRKQAFSIQLLQLADAALVWLAFWLANLVRSPLRDLLGQDATDAAGLGEMNWVLYLAVPITPLVLEFLGFYDRIRTKSTYTALSQLIRGLAVMALAIGMMAVFARLGGGSRLVLGNGAVFVLLLLLARFQATRSHLRSRGVDDRHKERVVVAGIEREIDALMEEIGPEVRQEWIVAGRFDLSCGSTAEFCELLKSESVSRVIFSPIGIEFGRVAAAVECCELQGVEAWISSTFIRTQIARPTFDAIGDKPMLVLRSTPELSWELFLKDVVDRVGAALLIAVSFPFWIFAWAGIRLTSPGAPVFFSQKRAGRYGQPFRMWKFRTMVPDAEKLLEKIKEDHGNEMDGPVFKLEEDPRIFPFGRFLRRLSIDEFPQLINVLIGDMSLVGPRPLPLYEVEAFERSDHRRRLSVKPGITCEWQAGGRNQITSFEQWVEMDLRYIDNWSLWLDFKILLKTVPAVLFGKGAK